MEEIKEEFAELKIAAATPLYTCTRCGNVVADRDLHNKQNHN